MAESGKKKWTEKELNQFKTLILEKRNEVTIELKEAKEKAEATGKLRFAKYEPHIYEIKDKSMGM